jgi:hypothetical protein
MLLDSRQQQTSANNDHQQIIGTQVFTVTTTANTSNRTPGRQDIKSMANEISPFEEHLMRSDVAMRKYLEYVCLSCS